MSEPRQIWWFTADIVAAGQNAIGVVAAGFWNSIGLVAISALNAMGPGRNRP